MRGLILCGLIVGCRELLWILLIIQESFGWSIGNCLVFFGGVSGGWGWLVDEGNDEKIILSFAVKESGIVPWFGSSLQLNVIQKLQALGPNLAKAFEGLVIMLCCVHYCDQCRKREQ